MEYTYYTPVRLNVHALYGGELAEIVGKKWVTKSGMPPRAMVCKYLQGCEGSDERVKGSLYYNTSHGLGRVYLYGEEYIADLIKSLDELSEKIDSNDIAVDVAGTKYHLCKNQK